MIILKFLTILGGGAFNLPTVEAVALSLDDMSGKTINSLITSNRTCYVSYSRGDDSIAIKGNIFKTFKTIGAAVSAATSGDLVYVFKDSYNVYNNIAKDGVDFYFEPNTYVYSSATTLFDISATTSLVSNVYGYGIFYCNQFLRYGYSVVINNIKPIVVEFDYMYANGYNIILAKMLKMVGNKIDIYDGNGQGSFRFYYDVDFNVSEVSSNSIHPLIYLSTDVDGYMNIRANKIINSHATGYSIEKSYNNLGKVNLDINYCKNIYINSRVFFKFHTVDKLIVDDNGVNNAQYPTHLFGNTITELINYFKGTLIVNSLVGDFDNYGDGVVQISCNKNETTSTWTLSSGSTIVDGSLTDSSVYNALFSIVVNGNAKLFLNAPIILKPTFTILNSYNNVTPFIHVNSTNALVEINQSIYNYVRNPLIKLSNGKLIVKTDLINMNSASTTDEIILFENGELVLNSATLKVNNINNAYSYPITCFGGNKDIKVLAGGLNLNKDTMDTRKKLIKVEVGGVVQNAESYSVTLLGTIYTVSGYTTQSDVITALYDSISAGTSAYTLTNYGVYMHIESKTFNDDFSYSISKSAGTGTFVAYLLRNLSCQLNNKTGGMILIDDDI